MGNVVDISGAELSINGQIVGTVQQNCEFKHVPTRAVAADFKQRTASISCSFEPSSKLLSAAETLIAYWSTEVVWRSGGRTGLRYIAGDDRMVGFGCGKHDAFIDLCGRMGAV